MDVNEWPYIELGGGMSERKIVRPMTSHVSLGYYMIIILETSSRVLVTSPRKTFYKNDGTMRKGRVDAIEALLLLNTGYQ